jgi:hypothetical protein
LAISPWAASTVDSLTGPIACMSSSSISAARAERFARSFCFSSGVAPLSAMPSLFVSISRSSVWRSRSESVRRSSKVKSFPRSSAASWEESFSISPMTSPCCCALQRRRISSATALPPTLRMPPATSAFSSVESAWPISFSTSGATESMTAMRRRMSARKRSGIRSITAAARLASSDERTSATVCGCSCESTMASASGSAVDTGPSTSSAGGGGSSPSKMRFATSAPSDRTATSRRTWPEATASPPTCSMAFTKKTSASGTAVEGCFASPRAPSATWRSCGSPSCRNRTPAVSGPSPSSTAATRV